MDLFWRRGYAETSRRICSKNCPSGAAAFTRPSARRNSSTLRPRSLLRSPGGRPGEDPRAATEIRPAVRQILGAMIEPIWPTPRADASWSTPHRVRRPTPCRRTGCRSDATRRVVTRRSPGAGEVAGELSADKNPVELARFLTTFVQGLRVVGQARLGRTFTEDASPWRCAPWTDHGRAPTHNPVSRAAACQNYVSINPQRNAHHGTASQGQGRRCHRSQQGHRPGRSRGDGPRRRPRRRRQPPLHTELDALASKTTTSRSCPSTWQRRRGPRPWSVRRQSVTAGSTSSSTTSALPNPATDSSRSATPTGSGSST